jgi:tenascin
MNVVLTGLVGADCSIPACPKECSNHGPCVDGFCQCSEGWIGTDCSQRACPNQCSSNVSCNRLIILFLLFPFLNFSEWTSAFFFLLFQGMCLESGVCACESGFVGSACNITVCVDNCSGHGNCNNGTCEVGQDILSLSSQCNTNSRSFISLCLLSPCLIHSR